MANPKQKTTGDAVKILHSRYIKNKPVREKSLAEEREKANIAEQISMIRTQAGLTQKQLANLAGTTQSVISRLEDADYDKHSMAMLERIARVLHHRVDIRLVPDTEAVHG